MTRYGNRYKNIKAWWFLPNFPSSTNIPVYCPRAWQQWRKIRYTRVGKSRFTVVCMEKGKQVMIITIVLLTQKNNSVFHVLTTVNLLFPALVHILYCGYRQRKNKCVPTCQMGEFSLTLFWTVEFYVYFYLFFLLLLKPCCLGDFHMKYLGQKGILLVMEIILLPWFCMNSDLKHYLISG